jgi:hypothetical protein
MQNDEFSEQRPPAHSFEQHSALAPQALPAVLHVVLSGVHFPLVHSPLQQSPLAAHARLSETHAFWPHFPPVQVSAQHSVPVVHAAFAAEQTPLPPVGVHVFVVPSQTPEQQSLPAPQVFP